MLNSPGKHFSLGVASGLPVSNLPPGLGTPTSDLFNAPLWGWCLVSACVGNHTVVFKFTLKFENHSEFSEAAPRVPLSRVPVPEVSLPPATTSAPELEAEASGSLDG